MKISGILRSLPTCLFIRLVNSNINYQPLYCLYAADKGSNKASIHLLAIYFTEK